MSAVLVRARPQDRSWPAYAAALLAGGLVGALAWAGVAAVRSLI